MADFQERTENELNTCFVWDRETYIKHYDMSIKHIEKSLEILRNMCNEQDVVSYAGEKEQHLLKMLNEMKAKKSVMCQGVKSEDK